MWAIEHLWFQRFQLFLENIEDSNFFTEIMPIKTRETYKDEILRAYKNEQGGSMRGYLSRPTRRQIREACLWLLDKRKAPYDETTLNRFFQFEEGRKHIFQVQEFKADKFVPIVKFLKGETKDTSDENLELISWLLDFKPRPLQIYLNHEGYIDKTGLNAFEISASTLNNKIIDKKILHKKRQPRQAKNNKHLTEKEGGRMMGKPKRRWCFSLKFKVALRTVLIVQFLYQLFYSTH